MDELAKKDILKHLIGVKGDELITIVLGIPNEPRRSQLGGGFDHSRYFSRIQMREALVNKQVSENSRALSSAVTKLTELGLKINPGTVTGTITVKGTPEQLMAAINEKFVESAILDFQIGVIEPKRGSEQD